MVLKVCIIQLVLLGIAHGGVLLIGSKNFAIPSLKMFDDEHLELLVSKLDYPHVLAFNLNPLKFSNKLKQYLSSYNNTVYIPKTLLLDVKVQVVLELENNEENYDAIKETISNVAMKNVLIMFWDNDRVKREVSPEEEPTEPSYEQPSGAKLYSAEGKAMIYSSKPPVLTANSSTTFLGEATIGTFDSRGDKYNRLSVSIPVEGGKISLRFKFPLNSGYWSLQSVELLDVDSKTYVLNIIDKFSVPKHFSYHCNGVMTFVDVQNQVELKLFDVQVQPDTVGGRFSNVYDCVSFMTGPIWSGLLVSTLLLIVLTIGINSLLSIKSMDKFDNSKTKQLSITTD